MLPAPSRFPISPLENISLYDKMIESIQDPGRIFSAISGE
jgi:hypothetical protein